MKDERKDFFRFVGGNEAERPFLKQPAAKAEIPDLPDEPEETDNMTVAEKLCMELSDCQGLMDYSDLFRNNVFFSGIILDIEEISETVDCGEESIENLVALKLQVYNMDFNAVCITDMQADIYLYPEAMDSPDILQEFEVGDLVGFSGRLKDDLELAELYDSDDAVDDYMSPSDISWTSAFMMHKNFLDTVGIDIPEDDKDSEDPV